MGLLGQGFNLGAFNPGGFAPSGSPAAWWDASAETAYADDQRVDTFFDQAGSNDLIAAGAARPFYKTAIQNGLNIVRFDGATSVMGPVAFTLTQPWTLFAAIQVDAYGANDRLFDALAVNNGTIYQSGGTPTINLYAQGGAAAANTSLTLGSWHVLTCVFNGASSLIRVDGANQTTGNPGAADPGGITMGAQSGGGNQCDMDVGEVIIYNSAESVAANEAMLAEKWGI